MVTCPFKNYIYSGQMWPWDTVLATGYKLTISKVWSLLLLAFPSCLELTGGSGGEEPPWDHEVTREDKGHHQEHGESLRTGAGSPYPADRLPLSILV